MSDRLFEPQPWLPSAPLFDALRTNGLTTNDAISKQSGVGYGTIYRARTTGWITAWAADNITIRALNLHPHNIWGDEWVDAAWLRDGYIDNAFETIRAAS